MRGKAGMLGANLLQLWDITTSRISATLDVSAEEQFPHGLALSQSGHDLYLCGTESDSVIRYTLQTPWDISTASYHSQISVAVYESVVRAVAFKPDGTRMYVVGNNQDQVHQFNLDEPWDVTSAFRATSANVAAQETAPFGLAFKSDGTKMFVVGVLQPTSIQEYSLATPWEVNSATSTASVSILSYEQYANGIAFSHDGMIAFIAGTENTTFGTGNDYITALDLPAPWSIASVSLRERFEFASPAVTPHDVAFKPDGTEMYVPDLSSSSIMQYSIG